jgi:hypothetical protein
MRRPTSRFLPAFRETSIDGLLREIVESSLPPVRRRICAEVAVMSAAELRGYLRARAHVAVRCQTLRLSAPYRFDSSSMEQLVQRALERTVNLLLRELTDQSPLILPMFDEPLRAAA